MQGDTEITGLETAETYYIVKSDASHIRLVDDLKPGEVPVLSCNGNLRIAPWGELLSTRAKFLGAKFLAVQAGDTRATMLRAGPAGTTWTRVSKRSAMIGTWEISPT